MNPELPDFMEFKTEYNRLLLFSEGHEAKSNNPEITRYGSMEVVLEGMLKGSGRICLNKAEYFDYDGFKRYIFGPFYEETEDIINVGITTSRFPDDQFIVSCEKKQDSDFSSSSYLDFKKIDKNPVALFKRIDDSKEDMSYEFDFYSPEYMGFFMEMFSEKCGYLD